MPDLTAAAGADVVSRSDVLATLLPGYVGPGLPDWIAAALDDGLGGVCLFGSNIESAAQVAALTAQLRTHNPGTVVAIDEEGGDVTRLFYATGSPYPGNALLGRMNDLALTEAVGRWVGRDVASVGVTLDLAPDADVNSNPLNPVIGVRSFGADPGLVAAHTAAWVRGLQSTGVAACAKHFPGHGDTSADSHRALPVVDADRATLRERELAPFRAAVTAGCRAIMTSHILLPQLDAENPATFSAAILSQLLRSELGFTGAIVTDALDMVGASGEIGIAEAAVRALAAGADLLCLGARTTPDELDGIVDAVQAAVAVGRLDGQRVADAAAWSRALGTAPQPTQGDAGEAPVAIPHARLIRAFDRSPRADAIVAQNAGRAWQFVRVDAEPNIAIGSAPWGPFAAGAVAAATIDGSDSGAAVPQLGDGPVAIVGRSLHLHPAARAAIDAIRARRDDVLVVDLGWPQAGYPDVACYGASSLVGASLLDYLAGSDFAGWEQS